ncbi:MAG: hypothetical protein J8272_00835, partial ['Prunus persica' phytoplasma PP2]|nr:hypothetical protein ['Prunus persica' phytoplasma PP2]
PSSDAGCGKPVGTCCCPLCSKIVVHLLSLSLSHTHTHTHAHTHTKSHPTNASFDSMSLYYIRPINVSWT